MHIYFTRKKDNKEKIKEKKQSSTVDTRRNRFLDILVFQCLTTEYGVAKEFQSSNNFLFIFLSSYAEMSFRDPKKSLKGTVTREF
jgi:hypothetical protein